MIRKLCYHHHITEFNALPNSRRHEASSWTTVTQEDCAECKRLAELEAETERLRASLREVLDEAISDHDRDIIITECQSALAKET